MYTSINHFEEEVDELFEDVKGKTVTFVPTRSTDDSRNGGIAEFSIITK